MTVTNSTISNNTGYAAIYNYGNDDSNQITLANATVSATTGFSIGGRGISMRNTILDHGTGPNCDVWPVASLGHNIVDDASCQLLAGDIQADAKLGGLAANGGPTETHALLSGSPAVDAGARLPGL